MSEVEEREQAVILLLAVRAERLCEFSKYEEQLFEFVEEYELGEYDGYDVTVKGDELTLYFYGPDAEKLFAELVPFLSQHEFGNLLQATLRFGPAEEGVPERVEKFEN